MPGSKITMDTHEVKAEEKKKYVIAYVEHNAFEETHLGTTTTRTTYTNNFKTLPATTVFRPPLITRRPLIPGPQTAKVVGPSGEEIYCDKYGRIRVQFFWDRYGKNNENSSCWIRVAQVYAGTNWGTIYTPRIGMEVIVVFLDGDPDQPLVVGSVYNADNMPPYTLPGSKTQSGIKTRSTTKGSSSTYNEMRIEDLKGSELFYFRAQKDFQREVMNNDTINVSNDRTMTVTKNISETVSQGNKSTTVSKGNVVMDVNSGNYNLTLGSGNANVKCDGGSILLQATNSITLKVGSNEIVINQSGVTIKGTLVEATADSTAKITGAVVQVNGSGMVKIAGGIVNIN
jgi:type VI secretion system secreted protein VgrG